MKLLNFLKNQYFWLILIILTAFLLRLIKINSPIADWHSWRQADTAAVTRNFIKSGLNPFLPRFDDMSGISERPLPNPNQFRFVEFPLYNMAVYPVYLIFGINETYHRLVSVLFSLGSIVFLYFISRKYLDTFLALLASFIFAILPYNVFFSRTTLPEPSFVFFSLGMLYFCDKWIEKGKFSLSIPAFIFSSLAFLSKPWAVFLLLPLYYSIYKKGGKKRKFLKYTLFFLAASAPFLLWRLWILQQPQGIPAAGWLLNGDGIRFRPAFFWWIISERIGREILGVTGAFLFFLGLIVRPKNGNYFLHFWALSQFLYFTVVATGSVRHDYYQMSFIPIASIFVSLGFVFLTGATRDFIDRIYVLFLALFFMLLTFYFTWTQIKGLYQINNPAIIAAGKTADKILPGNAVVVAPYNGDSAFLYQTNRPGFPVTFLPLKEMVTDYGVTSYISVNRDDKTNWVLRHFKILEDNPQFVIADLTQITKKFDDLDPEP